MSAAGASRAFRAAAVSGVDEGIMGSIDELLSDETVADEPVAEALPVEVPEEPVVETPRDEAGRFAPKGVDNGTPPVPDRLPQDEFKALKDERTKRQEAEQRAAYLEQQLQAKAAPPPTIWEDEQGWQQHFGTQVVSEAVNAASMNARLDMSEMLVRQANPDFDDMKEAFLALAKDNPTLAEQARADPHPWNKAYQIAKTHATMQQVGATDIDTLKAKLREELMVEMQQQPAARTALPPTLSGERNVGNRAGPAWTGPKPLAELLS